MSVIRGTIGRLVHETSSALIDRNIATKLSDAATGLIQSGFQVAEDMLRVAKDLSAPEDETSEEPEDS